MTSDEITNMAKEAGFLLLDGPADTEARLILLHRFAALVAAAEREACASLVQSNAEECDTYSTARRILDANAQAIRARGQA